MISTSPTAEPISGETAVRCVACGAGGARIFFEAEKLPVNVCMLWQSREAALECGRGDVRLAFCGGCGYVGNVAFEPQSQAYDGNYDNSLDFSPRFRAYARALAERLVERHALRSKDLIELGCGKGDFLALLCELGGNRGTGFDKSYVPGREPSATPSGVRFIQDYYSERYAGCACDFLCCRHVLEHIADPAAFLAGVRRALEGRPQAAVYFEVPNGLFMFRALSIWDVIYEHCSYFTRPSLERLFVDAGFEVLELGETFGDQFLTIEARPASHTRKAPARSRELDELAADVGHYAENYRAKVAHWQRALADATRLGQRVVLWGGGAKGAIFANTFAGQPALEYVVDLNPHKQGHYVPGSGQRIVAPEFLCDYRPDIVLVMNPAYREEIGQQLQALGLAAADVQTV